MCTKDLSLVIPVYNEVESLPALMQEIRAALDDQELDYEVIFIDDGSGDGSFELLELLHEEDERVAVIRFRRNHGQTAAFAAGFDHAPGRYIVTLDADRQNDPADIPKLSPVLRKVIAMWSTAGGKTARTRCSCAKFLRALLTGLSRRTRGVKLARSRLFAAHVSGRGRAGSASLRGNASFHP